MKKFMLGVAAVLFAMTATVLTSCGSDDETPIPEPAPEPKKVAAIVDYGIEFQLSEFNDSVGSIFALCDTVKVGYKDESGNEVKEVVVNGKWSKEVRYTETFSDGFVKLYLIGVDTTDLQYNKYRYEVKVTPVDATGYTAVYEDGTEDKSAFSNIHESHSALTPLKEDLSDFVKNYGTRSLVSRIGITF